MKLIIAIPAYNEEKIIGKNVNALRDFCDWNLSQHDWKIVVADNCSTDATKSIVSDIVKKDPRIQHFYVAQKGKGLAIRRAWLEDNADAYVFMDADLAVDLSALPALVSALYGQRY